MRSKKRLKTKMQIRHRMSDVVPNAEVRPNVWDPKCVIFIGIVCIEFVRKIESKNSVYDKKKQIIRKN